MCWRERRPIFLYGLTKQKRSINVFKVCMLTSKRNVFLLEII